MGTRTKGAGLYVKLAAALASLLFVGMFVSAAFADGGSSSSAPTVAIDQAAHVPGDTVHVTGAGWLPNESVHVHAAAGGHSFAYDADVVASVDGAVDASFTLPSEYADTFAVALSSALQGSVSTSFSDAFAAASSPAPPTIVTDASVYGPGATVTLSGAGWQPAESVHLFVNDDQGQTWSYSADVTADSAGTFTHQFQLPSSFVAHYAVTATGASGDSALAQFQDDAVVITFPTATTYTGASWAAGCATAGFCGTANGGNTASVKLSVRQGAGNYWGGTSFNSASENFIATTLTSAGGNNFNWTLAFPFANFSNGSYTVHVQGFDNKGGAISNDQASVTFTIQSQQATTLSAAAASGTYGGTTTLSATLTAGGSGVSGKSISFSLNGTSAGSATTNASGVATLTGVSLAGVNANTYPTGVSASFAGDSSFSASSGTASLTVNPKPATATADNQSKTYGQPDPTFTFTPSGVLSGDTLTGVTCGVTGAHANVGSYDITCSGNTNGNYSVTYVKGTLTVGAKSATATADNQSKTYGQADPSFTFTPSGVVAGDTLTGVSCGVVGAHTNAGGYDITCSGNTNANYSVTYVKGTLTVGAQAITVTADAKSKSYGDADPALTYQVTTGSLVGGDSFSGALTRDPGQSVGQYDIKQGTLTAGSNYNLTFVGAKLTINQRPITVTADAKSKTYGDADPALTYQLTSGSLQFNDTFSGALTRDPGQSVGQYDIKQGTLTAGSNYNLSFVGAKLTINQRPITVTADAKAKTYGDADPALTYQVTNGALAFSDAFSGALTRDAGENVGQYDIKRGALTAGSNYDLTFVGAKLTIGKATLAINTAGKTKVYGNTDPTPTYSFSGFQFSDNAGNVTIAGAANCSFAAGSGPDVGTYPGAISCGPGDLSATNYDFAGGGKGDLTITARPVEITADAKSKTYGDDDPALTFHVSSGSLAYSDAFSGSLVRAAGEDVGDYGITQGSVALSTNYTLTFIGAKLTIGKRSVEITADAKSKTYGNADPELTFQITDGSLAFSDAFTGTLDRAPGEAVADYAITQGTVALSDNYTLTYKGAKLTVNKRSVEITADSKSKTYGDDDPALTYHITDGSLAFSDAFTGSLSRDAGQNVGAYDITQGTVSLSGNYTLAYKGAKLTIDKRAIGITADAKSKTYGDADPALTYQVTSGSLAFSDSFAGSLSRDAGENVAKYDITKGTVALNGNYALSYVGAKLTIGKATLAINADGQTKVYGDATPAPTYSFSGFQLDDNAGNVTITGAADCSYADGSGPDVGTYEGAISCGPGNLSATNYDFAGGGKGDLAITARPVEITADAKSKTYGNADPALTYKVTSGSLAYSDAFSGGLARDAGENVGAYDITQGTVALNGNYTLTYEGAKLTIDTRPVEVTADPQSKTYGNANPALTYQITSGSLAFTDTFVGSLTRDAGENVGTYDIHQGSLALGGNYDLTFKGDQLTIKQRPVEITADSKSKTYGDADPALTFQITSGSLAFSDGFSGSLTRDAGEDVGTYAITQGTVALNGNYTLTYTSGTLTIEKRSVEITGADKTKFYGGADPALTYAITHGSLAFSDAFSGSLARDPGETVAGGPYAITQGSVALDDNYNLTFAPGKLTITKATLAINADGQTKVYGNANPAPTYSFSGFQFSDNAGTVTINGAADCSYTGGSGPNVATYQGAISCGPGNLSAANYDFAGGGKGDLTITKRPVEITADAKSKTYGDPDPALTYQVTSGNLVYSDTFIGDLARSAGEAVGDYAVTQGTVALSSNYDLSYNGAKLTIKTRPVEITADAKSKTYGDADPVLTFQITKGSLAFNDHFSGALTRDPGQDVGLYPITPGTVALSANYDLSYVGAKLTIGTRPVTVTADAKSKTYGDADPALTYKVTSGSPAYNDGFTGALTRDAGEPVGDYAITQGTLALSPNYALKYAGANLTIGKRPVTGSFKALNKVYDGGVSATVDTRTLNNTVSGDAVSLTGGTATFANKGAGSGKIVTLAGATLSGNDAGNYALGSVATATADITAKSITGGFSAGNKVYDGTTSATVGTRSLTGVVGNDAVALAGGTAAFDTKYVGTGKTVTLTGASLSGADASNYTLTSVDTAKADITKAPLTVTADNQVMTLNGTVPPLTYKVTGFVNSETAAVVSGTAACTTADGKTIGTFDIVCTIGGLDAQNYSFPAANFIKGKLTVYYRWDGFLQPINDTAHTGLLESKFKLGQTIPVKFNLKDAAGNVVQQAVNPTFTKTYLGASCGQTVADTVDASVTPDPSTVYTWDGSQYHYNWSTKGLQGGEYRIYANLADGTKQAVNICLS